VSFDRPFSRSGQPKRIEHDLAFIRWAEQANLDLTYATSIDLHAGRIDPEQYAGLVFCGHDEYWSAPMREHVTEALKHGTSLAFLEANNINWHIRIGAAPYRTIACYKQDFDIDPDPSWPGATVRWRDGRPGPHQAEQMLLGIQSRGAEVRPVPLIVDQPDHWFWTGTGVVAGEAIEDVVAGDVDGHDARYQRPAGTVTLGHSLSRAADGTELHQNTSVYETDPGAVVFASGSDGWTAALGFGGRADRRVQHATANLLDRMQAPRLKARYEQIAHLLVETEPTPEVEPADPTEPEANQNPQIRKVMGGLRRRLGGR
jgi:hypothetical protein